MRRHRTRPAEPSGRDGHRTEAVLRSGVTGRGRYRSGVLLVVALAAGSLTFAVAPGPAVPTAAADGNEAPGAPEAYRGLSAGESHTCAIVTASGRVKCWGSGQFGQLGGGNVITRGDGPGEMGVNLPAVVLGTGRTATAIAAGENHTCAVLDNGTVKCWGANHSGQLGLGDTDSRGDGVGEMGNALPAVALGTGRTATAITAGFGHTCALLDNGQVKCWGRNNGGELGIGDTNNRGDAPGEMGNSLPAVSLGSGRTAKALAAGYTHTCAVLDNDSVKCWGANLSGQLGLGDTTFRGTSADQMGDSLPVVSLGTARTATAITAGFAHTCALLDNDQVKCWGSGGSGQLGLGSAGTRGDIPGQMGNSLPAVSLGTGRHATGIAAGDFHTCAALDNGTLKCWGWNEYGQLGLGTTASQGDGPGEMGDSLNAVSLGTGRTVVAVTAGDTHTCARLDNGHVKCWGLNSHGQLGLGDTASRGDGPGEMGNNLPAVSLGVGAVSGTVTRSGSGAPVAGAWVAVLRVSDFSMAAGAVAAANGAFSTLLPTGTYYLYLVDPTGAHEAGFLGSPQVVSVTDGSSTVANGSMASLRGSVSGTVTAASGGAPLSGRWAFAIGPSGMAGGTVTAADGSYTVSGLAPGTYRATFVDPGGRPQQYFSNSPDYFGATPFNVTVGGDTGGIDAALGNPPVDLSLAVVDVAAGDNHTCARRGDGSVKCWGLNSFGQLGLGDTLTRGSGSAQMGDHLPVVALGAGRTATQVAAGGNHTCALLDNGQVKCWGRGEFGQLGLGDTATRGDGPGEMGDNLPAVALGAGRTATAITAGVNHTCARLDNATVKCWGFNGDGRLGLGDNLTRGDGPDEMGDNLPAVALGTGRTAQSVTAGGFHTCARLDNNQVKCWGDGAAGRLGYGDTTDRGDNPDEMGDNLPAVALGTGRTSLEVTGGEFHTCARLDNGTVKCWGFNDSGTLGLGDTNHRGDNPDEMGDALPAVALGTNRTATAIDAGRTHTCARLDNNSLKCWGAGGSGRLGLGDTTDRGDQAGEMGDALPAVALGANRTAAQISAGATHTCVRRDDYTAACWGNNTNGQLGVGNTLHRGDNPGEMGDSLITFTLVSFSAITGTVGSSAGGTIPGTFVAALRTTDFSIAGGAVANDSGSYAIFLRPGDYFIYLIDPAAAHDAGFASFTPTTAPIGDFTITNGLMVTTRGTMTGTVTDQASAAPIVGAWALAIGPTGIAGGALTGANGTYTIPRLPPGTYRATFVDPNGGRDQEYYLNSPDYPGATPIAITAGATATNINGTLQLP